MRATRPTTASLGTLPQTRAQHCMRVDVQMYSMCGRTNDRPGGLIRGVGGLARLPLSRVEGSRWSKDLSLSPSIRPVASISGHHSDIHLTNLSANEIIPSRPVTHGEHHRPIRNPNLPSSRLPLSSVLESRPALVFTSNIIPTSDST